MKKVLLIMIATLIVQGSFSQAESTFETGEWFKFKMSYSNWFKAGEATLNVNEDVINKKPVYHVVGNGWTTGPIKWFFKVEDRYESFFDKKTGLPYRFIRDI
jgi:hypothetical protein